MKTACVILAAGEGTRMRTRLPKVLHRVCGEPLIFYAVSLAVRRGYGPIVVVVSRRGDDVRRFLARRFGQRVRFALQDPPLGTGHAVMAARDALRKFKGKLVILYGDVPLLTTNDLAALERGGKGASVAFLTCRLEDPSWYGRVIRGEHDEVLRVVEHRDASATERRIREINAGIYLVDAPFVFSALDHVRKANAQGEYYLTDLIEQARLQGKRVRGVLRAAAREFQGVNSRAELAQAEFLMNHRLVTSLMNAGVSVADPGSTWVGPDVRVGRDTVLLPNCFLRGTVRIGSGCRIGPGAVITDSRIGAGVEVKAYSVLEECRVGQGCVVGPFARLRPGAEMGPAARVGNFVEMKKSLLGPGSKANHLTYLGDTTVGRNVNVGAGTITCNYDGVDKFPTVIEDGAFIGSDTQLVAPVTVGRGAIVGAGSTITVDVPPDALAVSRARQKNIRGYARRRRSAKKKRS